MNGLASKWDSPSNNMPVAELFKVLLMWALCALAVHLFAAWNVYIVNKGKDEDPKGLQRYLFGQSLVIGFVLAGWITSAGACS